MSKMLGADVGGLERAGRKCLDAAQTADQVAQVMQALVMALRALETFTGPWAEALINFLTTVVIPWLKRIASALRLFGKVLNGHAGAQRRVSAGLPVDFSALPTYPRPELPPANPAGSSTDPQWADVDPPDAETPDAPAAPGASGDGEPEPETFDTPPLAPAAASTPPPAGAGGGSSGGGGSWGGGGGSLPDLPATPEPSPPADPPAEAPEPEPSPSATPAPVTAVPVGGGGISAGQVAGLGATAAGAGLIGGASAYVAARRRAAQTDGSEVLGAASIDRPATARRGVATLADTQQPSRAGSPAGINAATETGAGTNGRRSS
jgi:hypothetical protein